MQDRIIKSGRFIAVLIAVAFLAGCTHTPPLLSECAARIKQYSIESYQGPFPMLDRRYIESPQ